MRSESEALWLRWEDLDLDGGFIKIVSGRHDHRTKSGKGRWVPLTERLVWGLRKHASEHRARIYGGQLCPWVFHHQIDRRHAKAGERIGSLRRALYNAIEAGGASGGVPTTRPPASPDNQVAGRRREFGSREGGRRPRGPTDHDGVHAPRSGASAESCPCTRRHKEAEGVLNPQGPKPSHRPSQATKGSCGKPAGALVFPRGAARIRTGE